MPKVSEEHKERRRGQILDGARRCFAQHGYEGATVARLEQEIGLSRGAIFNYFPSKDALFVELALEMSRRYTDIWLNKGFRAVLGAIVEADADWLSVQFEATRRVRTDPEFRRLVDEREQELAATRSERLDRLRPQVRDDVPIEAVAILLAFVANGLALGVSLGDEAPDIDLIAKLVEEGVAPR
jgi:AcrR family transcriptional regulator